MCTRARACVYVCRICLECVWNVCVCVRLVFGQLPSCSSCQCMLTHTYTHTLTHTHLHTHTHTHTTTQTYTTHYTIHTHNTHTNLPRTCAACTRPTAHIHPSHTKNTLHTHTKHTNCTDTPALALVRRAPGSFAGEFPAPHCRQMPLSVSVCL